MREQSALRAAAIASLVLALATWGGAALAQDKSDGQKDGKSDARKGERVLIFPLLSKLPDEKSAWPGKLTKILERTARNRGMQVTRATTSLEDTAMISGCSATSPECRTTMLEQLGADRGILGTVKPGATPDQLTVSIAQFDSAGQTSRKEFSLSRKTGSKEFAGVLPVVFGDPVPPDFADHVVGSKSSTDTTVAGVKTSTWIVLGSGGAAILTGSLFWGSASSLQSDIDAAPIDTAEDLQQLEELEQRARTRATVGNVLFATGAVAVGVGTFLAIRQYRQGSTVTLAGAPSRSQPTATAIAPSLLPGGLGVTFQTAW